MSDRVNESYTPVGGTELAQTLADTGLLYLVNATVLHLHGLALAVSVDDAGRVVALTLHEGEDPIGIWFDEAAILESRRRLHAAGLLRRARTLADGADGQPRGQASPRRSVLSPRHRPRQ
jgi:hypothetical protein